MTDTEAVVLLAKLITPELRDFAFVSSFHLWVKNVVKRFVWFQGTVGDQVLVADCFPFVVFVSLSFLFSLGVVFVVVWFFGLTFLRLK